MNKACADAICSRRAQLCSNIYLVARVRIFDTQCLLFYRGNCMGISYYIGNSFGIPYIIKTLREDAQLRARNKRCAI